jgi:DNA-binding SARP family transcriptional activator
MRGWLDVRYELLGPLRIVNGTEISFITAPKVEVLLSALLIEINHVVTADRLMAEIWGEQLPRRANAGLHVYISELRKFLRRLDRRGDSIVTRSPGYVLQQGDDRLDSQLFLERVELGRVAMRGRDFEKASEYFTQALSVWRGPVLGGVGTGPVLVGFATRLAEARMECTEMLVECQVQLRRHRQLIGPLYSLIAENPLRESFYRQLMVALYRSERRAEALQVYQSARRVLREEFGLEPCTQLRELHRAILQAGDDPSLDVPAVV